MTGPGLASALGWVATAVFAGSYLCKNADTLRRVQMFGALLWIGYGVLVRLSPVIAANLLLLVAAGWTAGHGKARESRLLPGDVAPPGER